MSLRHFLLLCFAATLAACGGRDSGNSNSANGEASGIRNTQTDTRNWYKRLSGTLADKAIAVQLHCYNGALNGSYQYTAIGQVIGLSGTDNVTAGATNFALAEAVTDVDDTSATAMWSLSRDGDTYTGLWKRGNKTFSILLREEYPEGTTRLTASYFSDSAALFPGKASSPQAIVSYAVLLPADQQKGFLYKTLSGQLFPGKNESDDVAVLVQKTSKEYFADYRASSAPATGMDVDSDDFSLQYSDDNALCVLYNDNGWLIVENFNSSYTGGAHGNYASLIENIDVKEGKVWHITDVIDDTTAMRPALAQAAIAYFRIAPGEALEDRMVVDAVPPTGNFYLSNTGITMLYNPYEIASYADGQIKLFFPYRRILPLLTPAFKARMGLSDVNGVALR